MPARVGAVAAAPRSGRTGGCGPRSSDGPPRATRGPGRRDRGRGRPRAVRPTRCVPARAGDARRRTRAVVQLGQRTRALIRRRHPVAEVPLPDSADALATRSDRQRRVRARPAAAPERVAATAALACGHNCTSPCRPWIATYPLRVTMRPAPSASTRIIGCNAPCNSGTTAKPRPELREPRGRDVVAPDAPDDTVERSELGSRRRHRRGASTVTFV